MSFGISCSFILVWSHEAEEEGGRGREERGGGGGRKEGRVREERRE